MAIIKQVFAKCNIPGPNLKERRALTHVVAAKHWLKGPLENRYYLKFDKVYFVVDTSTNEVWVEVLKDSSSCG